MSRSKETKLRIRIYDPNNDDVFWGTSQQNVKELLEAKYKNFKCSVESVGYSIRKNARLFGRFEITRVKK